MIGGWEGSVLIAATVTGFFQVATMEGLSLVVAIKPQAIRAVWLVADLALAIPLLFRLRKTGASTFRVRAPKPSVAEGTFLALTGLLLCGLLLVAWETPPNNFDSLLYHMARVVHWAQNESLHHYATAYGHQLWNPPFAEMSILTLRSLWGNDEPANLIQWSALVGVLIGVSGAARIFGLGRAGRMLAVAFALSLPMAILQATSTQNDLVTSFWLIASVFLVLLSRKTRLGKLELAALGATLGLGLLTKGTFYVYGLVVAGWFATTRPWRTRPRDSLVEISWIAVAVLALNLGHWSRNIAASASPLGPADWIGGHGAVTLTAMRQRLAVYPALLSSALAPHLATPWAGLNTVVNAGVKSAYQAFGVEENATVVFWAWNHEDYAGNPLHLPLIVLTLVGLAVSPRARRGGVLELSAVALVGFLLMVLLIPPAIDSVGVRLQVPLFLLWAPTLAAVLAAVWPRSLQPLAIGLLLLATPWMLFNLTRPLIGMQHEPSLLELPCTATLGCTQIGSVLTQTKADVLFANMRDAEEAYLRVTRTLEDSGCRDVGLRIDSSDPEYPFWYLLRAPQSGFHIETIFTSRELEPLLDRHFHPCAIICTVCGGRTRLHGMDLAATMGDVGLFLGEGFTWYEDG